METSKKSSLSSTTSSSTSTQTSTQTSSKTKKHIHVPVKSLSSISHKHPKELHKIIRSFKYIPPPTVVVPPTKESSKPTTFPPLEQREEKSSQVKTQEKHQEKHQEKPQTQPKQDDKLSQPPIQYVSLLKYISQDPSHKPFQSDPTKSELTKSITQELDKDIVNVCSEIDNENQLNVLKIRKMRHEILFNNFHIGDSFVKLSNNDIMKCVELISETIQKSWKNASKYTGKEQLTVQHPVISVENSMESLNNILSQLYHPHKVWISKATDNSSYFTSYSLLDIEYSIFSTPLTAMFFKYNDTPQLFYLYQIDKEELKDGDVVYLSSQNNVFIIKDKHLYHERLPKDEYLTGVGGSGGVMGYPIRLSFNEKESSFESKYDHLDNVHSDVFYKFCDDVDYTQITERTVEQN